MRVGCKYMVLHEGHCGRIVLEMCVENQGRRVRRGKLKWRAGEVRLRRFFFDAFNRGSFRKKPTVGLGALSENAKVRRLKRTQAIQCSVFKLFKFQALSLIPAALVSMTVPSTLSCVTPHRVPPLPCLPVPPPCHCYHLLGHRPHLLFPPPALQLLAVRSMRLVLDVRYLFFGGIFVQADLIDVSIAASPRRCSFARWCAVG
jgi:hypothetical protein